MSFLIRHSDGRQYELDDVKTFVEDYQPSGFVIADPQPRWGVAPELPKREKAKSKADEKSDGAAQ